jgi:hypothetical protein
VNPFTIEYVAEIARVLPLKLEPGEAEALRELLEGVRPLLDAVDALPCGPADDPFAFPAVLRSER